MKKVRKGDVVEQYPAGDLRALVISTNLAATSSMVWVDGELHSARVAMWRVNRGETFGVCQTHNFGESFLYCNLISFSAMPWWKRS